MTDDELKEAVRKLMYHNIKQGHSKLLNKDYFYVMPSPGNYPFQWWWDTCFNIFILCALGEGDLAKKNLKSLFEMQREDGFVGHMIFWESLFPKSKLNIFQSKLSWREFRPHMSSLIQPPLAAQALQRIYEETKDIEFVTKMLPKLKKYFRWLKLNRDFDGDNLISIISVFESGIDWKPSYDEVLGFLPGQATEKLFSKVISTECKNFLRFYNLEKIYRDRYFIMKEVMVNSMYAKDLKALSQLCEIVNDPEAAFYKSLSQDVNKRMYELMFDEEHLAFFDVYGSDNKQSKTLTFTIALPLLLDEFDYETGKELIRRHFLNPAEFALLYPIPSTAKSEPSFNPEESKFMWRGPTWVLANWFLHACFRKYDFHEEANQLTAITKDLVVQHGFREYYNPFTAEPYGAKDFTWGGLVLDMIAAGNNYT